MDGSCRLSSFHFVQLLGVADYCNVFKKKMALCQGCYEAGKMYNSGFREGRVKIQDGKETFIASLPGSSRSIVGLCSKVVPISKIRLLKLRATTVYMDQTVHINRTHMTSQ